MPPANSPDTEQPPQSLISALQQLESPINEDVLNLAATLGTQPDDNIGLDLDLDIHDQADDYGGERIRLHLLTREQQAELESLRIDRLGERLNRSRERLLERRRDELDQRDRLRRVMSRLSRLNDSSNSGSASISTNNNNNNNNNAAYGDRVPSQNSLYDWSPAMDLDAEADVDVEDELEQILVELRREQPNTHPEILRVLGRSQLDSDRERIRSISTRLNQERSASTAGESLRSTAILQSVRRHPRFSARSRDYLQRYNHDRESSQPTESQTRYLSESARHMAMQRLSDTRTSLDRERRDLLSRADSWRRSFHRSYHSPPPVAAPVSPMLERTVKYLSQIRHANSIDDSLNHALDAGFLGKEYFCIQYADFVTDTFTIPPPVKTSWLAPGAVLSGCQHATSAQHASNVASAAPGGDPSIFSSLTPPARPWLAHSYSTPRNRSRAAPEVAPAQTVPQDRWPVKVTIHEVDWESMSLSATMEAYNVPSHPRSYQTLRGLSDGTAEQYTRTSSITTFLEGEILDFNQHSLLTESFKSTALNDATYWRKLPPFQQLSDDEFVRALTSKKWFTQVLHKDWILMRWKERCFVKSLANSTRTNFPLPSWSSSTSSEVQTPYLPPPPPHPSFSDQYTPYRLVRDPETNQLQVEIAVSESGSSTTSQQQQQQQQHALFDDSGCGLTISGFYYISLRRSDGKLEGLYYDPQSSPYQCLELESRVGGAVGAWAFC